MNDRLLLKTLEPCLRKTGAYGCEDVLAYDFVSLMDLYEANFLKLKKLIPNLSSIESHALSRSEGHLDLHLKILERSRYTTTLFLSYRFDDGDTVRMEPNLKVRIYHDAGQAEVMAGKLHHGRLILDNLPADARRQKWQLNRFLSRWLQYCLRQQHEFPSESRTPR